jgi:hypothetical protein
VFLGDERVSRTGANLDSFLWLYALVQIQIKPPLEGPCWQSRLRRPTTPFVARDGSDYVYHFVTSFGDKLKRNAEVAVSRGG